jgi:copper chaperone NosL
MKNLPRIVFIVGVLSLLLVFAFPLWQITLFAPQYTDGITMYIWVNKISGNEPGVLQNINILNHYIGMQKIEPDAIPELKYFPFVIYGMVAMGMVLFFVNKAKGFIGWTIVLILLGILGIYDFYLWEYDYGHNLATDAPIKIPGMVYQPPLFGRKMLLNFEAFSYPHLGSLFLGLSIALGLVASWLAFRFKRKTKAAGLVSAFFCLLLFVSCSTEPRPINYGEEQCQHCHMTIVDQRYGSELVSDKGKIFTFDAIECLMFYMEENQSTWEHILVTPFTNPTNLAPAESTVFLRSPELNSPMGMNLTAFGTTVEARKFEQKYKGDIYSWKELVSSFSSLKPSNGLPYSKDTAP